MASGSVAVADLLPPGIMVIHFRAPPDYMERPAESGPYSRYAIQSALQLAKLGDVEAESNVGVMYASRGEYEKAAYWYRQAANAGLDTAAYNLGTLYFNGRGMPQDYTIAHQWFEQAARRGNKYAEFQLGMTYFTGQGVQKDPAQEMYWYARAARQGLPAAQYNIAVNYFNGEGVAQDRVAAYAWMLLATKGGLETKDALEIIAQGLSQEQIQSAEKLSHSLSKP
ncbi:MAG: sel1 repeat family protein [Gammaproteobacteria bacterium]|nr:sel1 repeat family protein [Gammaproteobacteria bacterium]